VGQGQLKVIFNNTDLVEVNI